MRASLLFLALSIANGATVGLSSVLRSTGYTTKRDISVSGYLDELTPIAKDVLVNQLAGPSIGADVNPPVPLPDVLNADTILPARCPHIRFP
jgi:hypothetical protein